MAAASRLGICDEAVGSVGEPGFGEYGCGGVVGVVVSGGRRGCGLFGRLW